MNHGADALRITPSYILKLKICPTDKQNFYLSVRDDTNRSLDSDVSWNENKTLLDKKINICMNNLDFRERQDG